MIDKQLLQKRFSKSAETYDQYANVQKAMARRLMGQLDLQHWQGRGKVSILEVGCGTGYLTSLLCKKFPDADITAVDIAPGMIHRAKSRLGQHKVRFLCTDIEEVSIDSRYDVIISNATFQWLNHPQRTVQRLGRSLSEQGTLLFSTFGNRTFHELHDSYQRAVQKLNLQQTHRLGQSFYSLAHLQQLCTEALNAITEDSYTIIGSEREETEYFSSVRDFFSSIQKVGASNSNQGSYCQRPSLFKEMIRTYEARYREKQRIRATYHCMYVQAVFREGS